MNPIYWLGYTLSNLVAKLYLRRRVVNPEKLAEPGGCLVVANHTSFLDPPIMGSAFPYPIYFVARKTLMSNAFAKFIFRYCQTIPIDQSKLQYSVLKRVVKRVQEGEKVLIFPEGERTRDGKMKERGATGVGLLIAKTKEPVLPIRMFGAYESMPRGANFPKPGRLTLVVGERVDMSDLLENSDLKGKDLYQSLSDRAMEAIAALEMPEDG
jgi:1-acyl-sn-glycerol-3-phosphate acyltransferase